MKRVLLYLLPLVLLAFAAPPVVALRHATPYWERYASVVTLRLLSPGAG